MRTGTFDASQDWTDWPVFLGSDPSTKSTGKGKELPFGLLKGIFGIWARLYLPFEY